MSKSKTLILNTAPPTEREVVLGVVAGLMPALRSWREAWQAAHPKQTVTSVYTTETKESTK